MKRVLGGIASVVVGTVFCLLVAVTVNGVMFP